MTAMDLITFITGLTLVIYGCVLIWNIRMIQRINDNQVELVKGISNLMYQVSRLEAEETKFQTASEVFMSESADWATGIDTFREEMLKSHPKIRGILDAKGKADKAEQTADEQKG